MEIVIVDYGMGNLGSIQNMLKRLGHRAQISGDSKLLSKADKLILPGVGSFDRAMMNIQERDLMDGLNDFKNSNKAILGICLGMQLLMSKSEEGKEAGLNWIPGTVKKFTPTESFKVPHMGWNNVRPASPSELTQRVDENSKYYFVHSYYVEVQDPQYSILKTEYIRSFDSGIQKGNVYGLQFHPEKSHKFGMNILKNFVDL